MSVNRLQLKVIVLGDPGVGKTSILTRFAIKEFSMTYKATVGADFLFKEMVVDGKNICLQLWDTAGQERFLSLGNRFYRGTDCCVLVYDITKGESFAHIENWRKEFLERSGNTETLFPFILLGNKYDLDKDRVVDTKKAKTWAVKHQIPFCEVSAKDDFRIDECFKDAARMCLSSRNLENYQVPMGAFSLSRKETETSKKKKCCNSN